MRIEKLGEGEPEVTVVGSLHGDEPCGKEAIEKFLSEDWEIKKPVQFIIANEKALEKGERFVDTDLNRCFPGNPESEKHEERLAAEIIEKVEGTKVLDLHSTRSTGEPFGVLDDSLSKEESFAAKHLDIENAVHFPEEEETLVSEADGINVECGMQGSESAVENAYSMIIDFLSAFKALDRELDKSRTDFYECIGKVGGAGWEFKAENFSLVEEGEVFAEKEGEKLRAEEDFYPVLMSTDGYENMLGFKAEKSKDR